MTEVQHEYGGDVGENPVTTQEPVRHVVAQAGLASASAIPGQVEVEDPDGGVD
jgi:hypothetical protein